MYGPCDLTFTTEERTENSHATILDCIQSIADSAEYLSADVQTRMVAMLERAEPTDPTP